MHVTDDRIVLDKELNKLDKLVLDFTEVLEDHADYVLVAGYVAILFGRSRVSEDIDVLVEELTRDEFDTLHNALHERFWCLNSTDKDELYSMLEDGHAIRYAREDEVIPNVEMKFGSLPSKTTVELNDRTIYVAPIAQQIAYKEERLQTRKDEEDALHLREVFADTLDEADIRRWKEELHE